LAAHRIRHISRAAAQADVALPLPLRCVRRVRVCMPRSGAAPIEPQDQHGRGVVRHALQHLLAPPSSTPSHEHDHGGSSSTPSLSPSFSIQCTNNAATTMGPPYDTCDGAVATYAAICDHPSQNVRDAMRNNCPVTCGLCGGSSYYYAGVRTPRSLALIAEVRTQSTTRDATRDCARSLVPSACRLQCTHTRLRVRTHRALISRDST
jgi:hypothetical protein